MPPKGFVPSRFRVRKIGDPTLRIPSEPVEDITHETIETLNRLARANRVYAGAGVCAPQIGVLDRMFMWDITPGVQGEIINPVIEEVDGETAFTEGCLSIPGIFFEITRPKTLLVSGIDREGNSVEYEANDVLARLVLHEVDHLDGILMTDRMDDDQWEQFKSEYKRLHRVSPAGDWRQDLGNRARPEHWETHPGE